MFWIATQQHQSRRHEFDTEVRSTVHQAAGQTRSALEKHLIG